MFIRNILRQLIAEAKKYFLSAIATPRISPIVAEKPSVNTKQCLKCADIMCPFDIDNMQCFFSNPDRMSDSYYFLPEHYEMVANYVLTNNIALKSFYEANSDFPKMFFNADALKFFKNSPYRNDFTFFNYHPYTKTHKIAKYPYSITCFFADKPNDSMRLNFDRYGNLFRSELIYWLGRNVYRFILEPKNRLYQVSKVYVTGEFNNNAKQKIFDFDLGAPV